METRCPDCSSWRRIGAKEGHDPACGNWGYQRRAGPVTVSIRGYSEMLIGYGGHSQIRIV